MSDRWVKVLRPGTVAIGRAQAHVFVTIKWDNGRLALEGVEGPWRTGNATGSSGQIRLDPDEISPAPGWTREMVATLADVWTRWHLNDMRAGCEHQRAARWNELPINPAQPTHAYGRHFPGQRSDSWNMLTWVTRAEHPNGLLDEPCPDCGYRYGTAWLHEDVPSDVLDWLLNLPDSDRNHPWGDHPRGEER